MFNSAQDFWKGLGSFWLHFENRSDLEAFWSGMFEALKESHRNLYKVSTGKFPEHSPDVWNHKYVSIPIIWSGVEDNRINQTNYFELPEEYVGTFSIPKLKGVNTEQELVQGTDYWIEDCNKIYFASLSGLENDESYIESQQVNLYAEDLYRIDPMIFNLLRKIADTENLITDQTPYFPFTYKNEVSSDQLYGPTIFQSLGAEEVEIAPLSNGGAAIVYRDFSFSYGYFVLVDAEGDVTAGPTQITNDSCIYFGVGQMANGNIMITYLKGNSPYYANYTIINTAGTILTSDVDIPGFSQRSDEFTVISLNNGNVLIDGVNDVGGAYTGKFVILSSSGSLIKDVDYAPYYAVSHHAAKLQNGNVVIVFGTDSPFEGRFVIYDENGNLIKSATTFVDGMGAYLQHPEVVSLSNGNFAIAFGQPTPDYGSFVIYDEDGNLVKSLTPYETGGVTYYNSTAAINDGNFVITYQHPTSNYVQYLVVDSSGTIIQPSTTMVATASYEQRVVTLANGTNMFTYDNLSDGNTEVFKIVGSESNDTYLIEKARLVKYMTWAMFYLRLQKPTITNLKKTYNILYNLPFAYEGGIASISNQSCTIGDYTYYLSSGGETWGIENGTTVSRFDPLVSGVEIKDRISNPAEIISEFGSLQDAYSFILEVSPVSNSIYDTDFINTYEEDFMDAAFNIKTTLI